MNTNRSYDMRHIAYLPEHNKLWGWFIVNTPVTKEDRWHGYRDAWCWWAQVGKVIMVKQHRYHPGYLGHLQATKAKNGYQQITESRLKELWPDFLDCLENRMIFALLSQ